jgi:peptidoglycan/xylan/chitin deacetylase (PgdA/CDA1 family)/glycosyltransferase involved in cell wall biosynthesis
MVATLRRQTRSDFEVIVAVDGSTDGTADALRDLRVSFPLTVLEQTNRGSAEARNFGAAAAVGELLLFLDDDMEAQPEMLEEHDRSHREGADVVLGHLPLHPASRQTVLSFGVGRWAERRRKRLATPGADLPLSELLTGQMSISREAFTLLGGFDTSFTRDGLFGGEDLDFGYRARKAGLHVIFNEAALSYQLWTVDPATYMRRSREAGRSAEELMVKHPELKHELDVGPNFNSLGSRVVFGTFALTPPALSWPLRALAAHRVRNGKMDLLTYRLFFAVQTMEFRRGSRQARRRLRTGDAVVLAYHAISDLGGDPVLAEYGVTPQRFAEHLDALAGHGRRFVTLQAVLRALDGEETLPNGAVLVTFDDAYSDLLTAACPILAERGIPGVTFVVAGQIGGTNEWDRPLGARVLSLLDEEGLHRVAAQEIAIGSHGVTHRPLVGLAPSDLASELQDSAARLSSIGLPEPKVLSYPHGAWSPEVAAAAEQAGYAAAFAVSPGVVRRSENRYALPRIEVLASDSPFVLRLKVATAAWPDPWRRRVLRLVGA